MEDPLDAASFAETTHEPVQTPEHPQSPIDLPRRRSALGSSQIISSDIQEFAARLPIHPEIQATPSRVQTATGHNIGKKRGTTTPVARSIATPSHNAQMRKIFQNAQVSLRRDIAFASSPGGSIASRLPPDVWQESPSDCFHQTDAPPSRQLEHRDKDWRYSIAPQTVAKAEIDIREPLPERSPLLPSSMTAETDDLKAIAAEPMSSGFTSPAWPQADDIEMVTASLLPALPESGSSVSKSESETSLHSFSELSSRGALSSRRIVSTDLERPLTDFHVSQGDIWNEGTVDESPSLNRRSQRTSVTFILEDTPSPDSPDNPIYLSTAARAAAESAKAKRGLLVESMRSKSNKENIRPARRCPDPSLHLGTPGDVMRSPPLHTTPNPYTLNELATNSRHRDQCSFQPSAALYNRVDSKGSPLPILKTKPSLASSELPQYPLRQGYFPSPPQRQGPYFPQESTRPPGHLHQAPAHIQPEWVHVTHSHLQPQLPPALLHPTNASPFTYSFSTAAAKITGSSVAPDYVIRDSYRTDTLTPFVKPPTRFRKNGIAANRGVVLHYGHDEPTRDRLPRRAMDLASGRERKPLVRPGLGMEPKSPERVHSHSSPLRPVGSEAAGPRGKRKRNDKFGPMNFENREGDEAIARADAELADPVSLTQSEEMDLRELSPNVTPFRKGRTPRRRKRSRNANYWDRDILADQTGSPEKNDLEFMDSRVDDEVGIPFNAEQASLGEEVAKADELLRKTLPGYINAAKEDIAHGDDEAVGAKEEDDDDGGRNNLDRDMEAEC